MRNTDSEDASIEVIIKNVLNEILDQIEQELDGQLYRPLGKQRLNKLNTFIQNELDQIKMNEMKALDQLLESMNEKYYGSKEEIQEEQLLLEEQSVYSESTCCSSCKTETSLYWRRVAMKKIVCNSCFFDKTYLITFDDNYLNSKKSLEELLKLKTRNHRKNNLLNSNSINQTNSSSQSNLAGYLNGLSASDLSQLNSKPLTRTAAAANNTKNVLQKQISCSSSTSSASSIKTEREHETSNENLLENVRKLRKSTRINSNGTQNGSQFQNERANSNHISTQCKEESNCVNRRTKKFKQEVKAPVKIEMFITKPVNSDYVFHRGFFMQIGDIVALYDASNPDDFFFAQIRAFFTDQYGQKSAVITWLVPTSSEYAEQIETIRDFDPRKFALGPAEEMPRSLDQMEFVCRLIDSNNKATCGKDNLKSEDGEEFIDAECQFKNDLLKHKFLLDDLIKSKFSLLTNSQF